MVVNKANNPSAVIMTPTPYSSMILPPTKVMAINNKLTAMFKEDIAVARYFDSNSRLAYWSSNENLAMPANWTRIIKKIEIVFEAQYPGK